MVFNLFLASAPPDGRIFGLDQQTFIQTLAQLINLIILAVVLAIVLYRPVRKALHARTDRIQEQIAQAEEDMAKAAELQLQYEQNIKDIQQERDAILSEARKIAADTSQRLLADAKKEADAIKNRATANAEMEMERAEADMRTAIIEVSSVMAEKFLTLAINKETHDKLFEEAISGLEETRWRS